MIKKYLDDLVYQIKSSQNSGIKINLFLGAGASISANIPSASGVVNDILSIYEEKPAVQRLTSEPSYLEAVDALNSTERKDLFKKYIDSSHISITYLYLVELYAAGCIEYIITTNFDDLVLRALALKGIFPPIYDLTTIEKFSTSRPTEGAVIFLHGRHNGDWQLNTDAEMNKISNSCKELFDKIGDNVWITLGYSGDDKVFDKLSSVLRFTNELYWIGYKENEPNERVKDKLLHDENKQAYLIEGHDSDSFMKTLYINLIEEKVPTILRNPFSTMSNLYDGMVEIDSKEYPKESLFLNLAKSQISSMVRRFEDNSKVSDEFFSKEDEYIQVELINIIREQKFNDNEDKIKEIDEYVLRNIFLFPDLGNFYREWGAFLFNLGMKAAAGTVFFEEAILKFKKSEFYLLPYKGLKAPLYSNWFSCLFNLAMRTRNRQQFLDAIDLWEKGIEDDPNYEMLYFNRGCTDIQFLTTLNDDNEKRERLFSAIGFFKKAISLNDSYIDAWENLGLSYIGLGDLENKNENQNQALDILKEAFKRGSNSFNLVQLCIMKGLIDDGLDYLERIKEMNPGMISQIFSNGYMPPFFDKISENERLKEIIEKE
ncbi:hypothetical protein [uncultured Elizabethkingia sp.]|uniref:hypothetical protein n=1 Tax=uncultured Elizabethkingia sp. TaxID=432638 RepID=UPI0025983399|nr:hypothetical protein [uncultured Elizabethkingia sp.]